jgi:hypothetical protein
MRDSKCGGGVVIPVAEEERRGRDVGEPRDEVLSCSGTGVGSGPY